MSGCENKYDCIKKYIKTIPGETKYNSKLPVFENITKQEQDTLNQLIKDIFWIECTKYSSKIYYNNKQQIHHNLVKLFSDKKFETQDDDPKVIEIEIEDIIVEKTKNNTKYECIKKYADEILKQTDFGIIPPIIENITKEEEYTLNLLVSDVFWYTCYCLNKYMPVEDEIIKIRESIHYLFDYEPFKFD